MAESDYICVYRQFFEEFARTSQMEDSRPMRVNLYDLSIDELVGEVMQSCVNYLVERKCPRSLVVPLTKIVVEELINEAKKEPGEVNTPLKLNRKTHDKISEVCLRYTDNEKLSNLPGPVQETCYSTHSTKHTRRRMEDRLICLPRFNTLHGIQSNSEAGYYGIFDGHSGVNAACYAVSHLHQFLAESEYYPADPVQAFRQAFEKTESKYNLKDENSGTAVLAILHQPVEKKLIVAWVGDSEALLVNEDSYVLLVDPHKPERTDERKRIEAIGGSIIRLQNIYRVNGGLAISRAIGDKKLKPYVSAEPEIRVLNLTGSEHFIVMGCDGLWDVVKPQEVIETVYFEVKKNEGQIDSVAKRLVDLAKENNSTDNISIIVIFLTDPAEINNRSVDVTGHRPKILHRDGVIMEANFQTNDKSPFSDPGMNGIYETNGNHFSDHMQNESDEDLGPETDVDAVDDVLTSTKNINPFAKDCWQKMADENSDKLIELPKNMGDEIMKFAEDFVESAKHVDEKDSNQINSRELESDKFLVDSTNPFENPSKINMSEASNILSSFSEDNNKYVDEITSKKEEADTLAASNTEDLAFELKNDADVLKKSEQNTSERDLFSFDKNGVTDIRQDDSCLTAENQERFFNEDKNTEVEKDVEEPTLESPNEKPSLAEFNSEFDAVSPNENNESPTNQTNTTLNKTDDFRDVTFSTNEEAVNLISQSVPPNAGGHPPELCSVIDVVEAEKLSSGLYPMDKSFAGREGDEPSTELLSPSVPATDGELKDETVAESGGEVEDSEDDEWNYIKVESGTHQAVPVESKTSDLVHFPNEIPEIEKPTMNSPLNPEADEFIPVSSMTNLNATPKKPIPDDLIDIIASSPNWNNMNNVSLPEESAFLNEIRSRPSNIFENTESSQQEDSSEENQVVNNSLNLITSEEGEKENYFVNVPETEPRGLDLASDMTSSFIDPSTMSPEIETTKEKEEKQKHDLINSQTEDSIIEKKDLFLKEEVSKSEELTNVEDPSKSDLLSPEFAEDHVSPSTQSVDVLKSNTAEPSSFVSDLASLKTCETPVLEMPISAETSSLNNAQTLGEPQTLPESLEKSSMEEKTTETVSLKQSDIDVAAAAALTTAVAAAGIAAVKKDIQKPAPKSNVNEVSKTSKSSLNGTKTSAAPKRPTPSAITKTATGKTAGSVTKTTTTTTVTKTSVINKTQPKTTVSSTITKAPARPRPTAAAPTTAKPSPPAKTTVTASPTKPTTTSTALNKTTTRTPGSAPVSATSKPKPRVSPAAPIEKKQITNTNGEVKSTVKRTELITKRTGGTTNTTTMTTTTSTRVSLSSRPTTAPTKPTTSKTTVPTTRTVTAKPRTTVSTTSGSSPVTSASKVSPTARKSTLSADKQAKEVANRLTSKTATAPKTNGVPPRNTITSVTKTKKTLTSTTATPSNPKTRSKTENKAEKTVEEKIEVSQSENGAPVFEKTTDINLINSITSE